MEALPDPPRPTHHDPIAIALAEDLGPGDLTSRFFVGNQHGKARIFAREPAVAAGVETAAEVFQRVDPSLAVKIVRPSGARLVKGNTVLEISGRIRSILTAERVALNFVQRLSGVATLTRRFVEAVRSYFRQPRIGGVLAFIMLYRFGESMLTTMSPSFLLAKEKDGGMQLSTGDVGLYSGTVGVLALVAGGVLGGWWISRVGLRRSLWPMALAMHVPNVLYAWAAFTHPGKLAIAGVIGVEQLGYGFGFSAYMVVLMRVSQGRGFSTSLYAVSTGLMALSALAAGYVSGDLVEWLGFDWFFVVICVSAIPSLATLLFLPKDLEVRADA